MYIKSIYIFTLSCMAWAACMLSSCSSDAPENVDDIKGFEMSFAAAGLSRASVTTSLSEFSLYGNVKSPLEVIFNSTKVVYDNDRWIYEGTKYWAPGHEYSFVAIYPPLSELSAPQYSDSKLSFTYTIPANNQATDIVAATHRRLYNLNNSGNTATFQFNHIQSLINIAPALADDNMEADEFISFHELKLSGFKTKAEFSIMPASLPTPDGATDAGEISITPNEEEGDGDLTIMFSPPIEVVNHKPKVNLFNPDDAIVMLPQTFVGNTTAQIILTYSVNDDSSRKHVTIPLKDLIWDSGKSYTYTFNFAIAKSEVNFESATIDDWNICEVEEIDLIKKPQPTN